MKYTSTVIAFGLLGILSLTLFAANSSPGTAPAVEPNAQIASGWWPEFENTWVPIGWKDHPLRFNVIYNGTLIADPVRYPKRGQGVQLTFLPSADGAPPRATTTQPYQLRGLDGGVGDQGWTEDAAPVLWTRWHRDGIVLRQEVFAHVPGGTAVKTSGEPLYAWVRLSLEKVAADCHLKRYGVLVRVNRPHIALNMDRNLNLLADPAKSAYPRPLRMEPAVKPGAAHLIVDDADSVRLAVVAESTCSVRLADRHAGEPDVYVYVDFPATEGFHADLLVPLLPAERGQMAAELAVGRSAALAEANRFWAAVPETAARVDTPEPLVNAAFRQAPRFAEVIAERHPETGQHSLLSGSWNYEMLWATPTCMNITMILDGLGYHAIAAKYLDIFRKEQGTIVPPGGGYRKHPGYLATPRTLTSIDWLSDHGAILYAVCHHALVSGDKEFIEQWTNPILLACEFIRDSRASGGHDGIKGLLPAAVATDTGQREQAVWNDGWNYKALATAVRLLQRMGHPRAEEFAREARDYRETFVRAMREAMPHMPEWSDADGRQHRFVPTALPGGGDVKHQFYLDTGPLFLVYAGLMDADDELMHLALRYFREGPNTLKYDLAGAWHQPISLRHELSSCEPCYSWNVYHAWQLGDRMHFLEGMYSLLTGSVSRRTAIGCEHRGGISGTLFSLPLTLDTARLAVIDDQVEPGSLHLLRLTPQAWFTAERATSFENIPTEFGPVTLRFQLGKDGRLEVSFAPHFRVTPKRVLLHVPTHSKLSGVSVNRQAYEAKAGETVSLGG